ncbi:MAG: tetratricopeptide repeat protein [Muribaculaceae bacterium]|nr:tetratricopeptide repeat protein [Muribaculaceae bacterium]
MNRKSLIMLSAVGLLALTGCSKKLNQFNAEYFSVNPSPLEVVGQRVPATVTGHVPQKFFVKNAEVTVTPYLVFDGQEVASQSYSFQGEKVRGNNPVIYYEQGGTVTIPVMFNYQPEMRKSELELAFEVTQGNKKYTLPRVKVADGVVATAALADAGTVAPAIAPDAFQRIINEKYAADIRFLVNRANLRASETGSQQVLNLNEQLQAANAAENREIAEINISSYASPEGGLDFNTRLAEKREKATTEYMRKQLNKDKITEFGELTAQFTAEDWEGFQRLVAASDIQDKELILNVLSRFKDPEEREQQIRNLSSIFDQLAEQILPQLRYSRITASINVIGKSDEEIMNLFTTNPSALNVEEVLYAATLVTEGTDKYSVYNTAATLYPNDYRAYNNLGMMQYEAGDYEAAKASFAAAARLNPSAAEPQMNLGLIALVNKDYRQANQKFGNAAGLEELDGALGTYYLLSGDNTAAVKAFGNTASNNAALAQILTKDYSKAKSTLAGITNPDETTYYLLAVLGARTNNEQMVKTNLRQAVKLNRNLYDVAQKDLEFANFNLAAIF